MKIQDLGELHGDVLLFGGVYSNFQALTALLETARLRNIVPANMVCSGDVVAYCADGQACAQTLRLLGNPVLAGNCEVQLAQGADDCGCGFDDGSQCALLSRGWYAHALATVSDPNKDWMGQLPARILFWHSGTRYAVVHGGASHISRFIWPVSTDADVAAEFALLEDQVGSVDHVIAGHSGIPMQRKIGAKVWSNTGAIGMPPHDGDNRGCYAILTDQGITFERLAYDAEFAACAMESLGLVQGYHATLRSGFWPSEDTLPKEMRISPSGRTS